ncbi:MAG TPA: hypothetical protein VN414_05445 [Methanosarcina sp.]|nr:hypothetical protein [Methanosarcina sp.]
MKNVKFRLYFRIYPAYINTTGRSVANTLKSKKPLLAVIAGCALILAFEAFISLRGSENAKKPIENSL